MLEFFDCNACYGTFSVPPFKPARSVDDLRDEMAWCGIQRALVRHAVQIDESPVVGNRLVVEQTAGYDNLEPAWAILPPQTEELGDVNSFLLDLKAAGVRALWAYPSKHKYLLNAETFGELFEELTALRVPLFLPLAEQSGGSSGWALAAEVLREFPRLRLTVTAHGSWGHDRYFRPLVEKYPGLHLDISRYELDGGLRDFCRRYGPDRLLFGTNFPHTPMGGPRLMVTHAGLRDEERAAIAGGNLRRLLEEVAL